MLLIILFTLLPNLIVSRSLIPISEHKDATCSYNKDDYSLSWLYDDLSSDIVFKLATKSNLQNFWTGVYLGDNEPTDAIGVFVRSGQIGLVDAHVSADGVESDNLTNVQSLAFDLQDGKITAEFARPITTNDDNDVDLSNCMTFYFPTTPLEIDVGGPIELPSNMKSQRVCDISVFCTSRDQPSELVKRAEPAVCEYRQGKNSINYKVEGNDIVFMIDQNVKKGKWWTSVGFGEKMADMEMIVAFTENGKTKSIGGYRAKGYGIPQPEERVAPKLNKKISKIQNGKSIIEFSINSDVVRNYTRKNGCVTLQIGFLSGQYSGNFEIKKHETIPQSVVVCKIKRCGSSSPNVRVSVDEEEVAKETIIKNEEKIFPNDDTIHTTAADKANEPIEEDFSNDSQTTFIAKDENFGHRNSSELNEGSGELTTANATGNSTSIFAAALESIDRFEEGSGSVPVGAGSSPLDPQGENDTLTSEAREKDTPFNSENEVDAKNMAQEFEEVKKVEEKNFVSSTVDFEMKTVDGMVSLKMTTVDGVASVASTAVPSNTTNSHDAFESSDAPRKEPMDTKRETTASAGILEVGSLSNAPIHLQPTSATPQPEAIRLSTPQPSALPDSDNDKNPSDQSSTTKTVSTLTALSKNECSSDHIDLHVCEGYFADYLMKVEEWAKKHKQTVGQQMWKACKLLSEVKHVPSMCCSAFRMTCASHLNL